MPRARGSEMPQRLSTRGLRTSSSDSDPLPHRPMTDRSPKLRSPRTPHSHSEPLNQKKLGTRIAGLETQLEQAQGELKILKDQLASAEAAKKEAQKELEKRNTKPTVVPEIVPVKETRTSPSENNEDSNKVIIGEEHDENPNENEKETDVFEVPIEKVEVTPVFDSHQDELKAKQVNKISPESPCLDESTAALVKKNEEISLLKLKIEEKEKELEASIEENESLKRQLTEVNIEISSAKAKEGKTNVKLNEVEEELKKSKTEGLGLKEKLKEVETAKEALETEMKKLRVQTEQWKKAADAAAAILAGGAENEGRRVSERCGSMEKHYGGVFDGYGGFVGSPGFGDESDDGGLGNGKRKGSSGIRMFGDLWKKKGQK